MAVTIKSRDIGPGLKGWISSSGVIYSGDSEYDEHSDMADELEADWSWIRWLTSRHGNSLMFDVSGMPAPERERGIAICRSIAKQITYPFDEVIVDGVSGSYWKGTLDNFIKFGVKGRRKTSFESRLNAALRMLD